MTHYKLIPGWSTILLMFNKKNLPLLVSLAIPVLMILFVAAAVYLPALFAAPPQYDFLFAFNNNYYDNRYRYRVDSGRVVRIDLPMPPERQKEPHAPTPLDPELYLYDVETDTARQISLEETQKLRISDNVQSPDGYEVRQGRGGSDFPFFFHSSYDWQARYLVGHGTSRLLHLPRKGDPNYYDNVQFLGWILP